MARITPKIISPVQIGPCSLVYTANSAQMRNLSLPLSSSATLNAGAGLTASIDLAPGYMNFYSGLDGNPVALVSSSVIGSFGVATLTMAATQGSVVLGRWYADIEIDTEMLTSHSCGWRSHAISPITQARRSMPARRSFSPTSCRSRQAAA